MGPSIQSLLDRYYPITPTGRRRLDSDAAFFGWIESSIDLANAEILNIGAGPTPDPARRLRGRVRRYVGVDPDPVVLSNQDLDEARVNDGILLPFADATFDAALSDWTLEHVAAPKPFLREVNRVLKPGASYWVRTNNLRHYAALISRATPHGFHRYVVRRNQRYVTRGHEPWPTQYRMNTRRTLSRLLLGAAFEKPEFLMLESNPGAYLAFSRPLFMLGVAYERTVNRISWLSGLRFTLMARARKPLS
jgi:SAM-dependent methyltransferase